MSNSIVFKTEFERQIKNNKCSSYIDQNAKYNSIMQNSAQTKPKNYKKIKSFISHKIRKFLYHNPEQLQHVKKTKQMQVQLTKFDYKSNFVAIETTEMTRQNCASRLRRTQQLTPIQQQSTRSRRYSNGTSSSNSTSSLSSYNSEQFFLMTSENDFTNEQQQQSSLNFTKNFVQSSTPVIKNRLIKLNNLSAQENDSDRSMFSFFQENCQPADEISQLDESTQCQESPVLIESTFNNSSLSNLSDDLIIVQITNAPKQNKCSDTLVDNLNIINKYHNNTDASLKQPQWALGHNLNLALVNQIYFNPAANGVFNSQK